MKKIMKTLKENKYTVIAILCFFVLLGLGFMVYNLFFSGAGKPIYGNRLDGIEKVKVTDKQFKDIDEVLEKNKNITEIDHNIKGKIINFFITVKEKTPEADAKTIPDAILKEFKEEQVKFYDFQVFITCLDEEDKAYPIIGYKSIAKKAFSFSSGS